MRLVSYAADAGPRGAIERPDGSLVDLAAAAQAAGLEHIPVQVIDALSLDRPALDRVDAAARGLAGEGLVTGSPDRLAPVLSPSKVLCLGLNYRDHAAEADLALPAAPMVFGKYANSITGPDATVPVPVAARQIDYEAELAVVVGRRARDIPADERAVDFLFGAMALNDLTARDLQLQTSQWTAGKAIDGFAPTGPALVSLDEVGDLQSLGVRAWVNGELVQDSSTAQMIFDVEAIVRFLASFMTLVPGDVIATGTPAGVGFTREPQLLLGDQDVVEVEVERVGRLSNRIAAAHLRDRASRARTGATA